MPKGEHTVVSTSLSVEQIRKTLSSVLSGAKIEELNRTPLESGAALAIVASQFGGVAFKRSPFGPGNAVAQIIVEDHSSARKIELIAIRDTFGESWNKQRAAGNAMAGLSAVNQSPKLRAGRNMVDAMLAALRSADRNLQQL